MVIYVIDSINWIAIIVAAISAFVFGFIWYSDFMFGKEWRKELGKPLGANKPPVLLLVVDFAMILISAFSIELLVIALNIAGLKESVGLGLIAGIGLIAANMLPGYLFEGRTIKLFSISAGNQAASAILIAVILGAWR